MKKLASARRPTTAVADASHAPAQADNRTSTVQARTLLQAIETSPRQVTQRAAAPQPNRTGLPNKLKAGVENLSGHSLDDVRVHYNSDKPAQLQAHAYAQGSEIHVAPGQEKHLPHEAWHVVQQKQGRVRATRQMKGVAVNDNLGLEREADVMGARALSGSQPGSTTSKLAGVENLTGNIIQRVVDIRTGVTIKNGPPKTIHNANYFYKVFGSKAQAETMEATWTTAEQEGIPVPVHKVVKVNTTDGERWAFRSKAVGGTFFQFSKPGHIIRLTNWIDIQTSRRELVLLRNVFSHVRTSIGDGQGFFDNTDGGNIYFIDINISGTTPNAADVVSAIDARLHALAPA